MERTNRRPRSTTGPDGTPPTSSRASEGRRPTRQRRTPGPTWRTSAARRRRINEAKAEFRSGVGARWPFLSDPGRKLQKELDIAEYTDPHHNPMIPHTVVLEPGLRIYKIYGGYWFFGRPTVEELRLDLRAVLQRCRPDWDIATAEQRTAWARGEKASFYPYGKTDAEVLAEQE